MPVKPVVTLPARVLKERAEELAEDRDPDLIQDLIDTMRASPACVGLAAPQIGVSRRAIVVDVSSHPKTTEHHGLITLLDPVIVEASRFKVGREGCMSVPDLTANVRRATRITVKARSPEGEKVSLTSEGFEARALQHEIDHIDGLLILDRVASVAHDVFARQVYR